jgi:pilus assembly protein FimV
MLIRKIVSRAAALALAGIACGVQAVSLGNLTVVSQPGDPLNAVLEVEDVDFTVSPLLVRVAPQSAYAREGIEWPEEAKNLRMQRDPRRSTVALRISGAQLSKGETFPLLIEMNAGGRVTVRNYQISLDESGRFKVDASAVRAASAKKTAAKSRRAGRRSALDAPRIVREYVALNGFDASEPFHVQRYMTLWSVAKLYWPSYRGATLEQLLIAFRDKNPKAFDKENPHQLVAGSVLRPPKADAVFAVDPVAAFRAIHGADTPIPAFTQNLIDAQRVSRDASAAVADAQDRSRTAGHSLKEIEAAGREELKVQQAGNAVETAAASEEKNAPGAVPALSAVRTAEAKAAEPAAANAAAAGAAAPAPASENQAAAAASENAAAAGAVAAAPASDNAAAAPASENAAASGAAPASPAAEGAAAAGAAAPAPASDNAAAAPASENAAASDAAAPAPASDNAAPAPVSENASASGAAENAAAAGTAAAENADAAGNAAAPAAQGTAASGEAAAPAADAAEQPASNDDKADAASEAKPGESAQAAPNPAEEQGESTKGREQTSLDADAASANKKADEQQKAAEAAAKKSESAALKTEQQGAPEKGAAAGSKTSEPAGKNVGWGIVAVIVIALLAFFGLRRKPEDKKEGAAVTLQKDVKPTSEAQLTALRKTVDEAVKNGTTAGAMGAGAMAYSEALSKEEKAAKSDQPWIDPNDSELPPIDPEEAARSADPQTVAQAEKTLSGVSLDLSDKAADDTEEKVEEVKKIAEEAMSEPEEEEPATPKERALKTALDAKLKLAQSFFAQHAEKEALELLDEVKRRGTRSQKRLAADLERRIREAAGAAK